MKLLVDLIKSGSYIDIFYAKTCATTKISTVAGYHVVLAMRLLDNILSFDKRKVHVCRTEIYNYIISEAKFSE